MEQKWAKEDSDALFLIQRSHFLVTSDMLCAGLGRQPGELTFKRITEALRERFVGDRESYLTPLQNARREPAESLDQLADRLRKLFVRAYPVISLLTCMLASNKLKC